MTKLDENLQVDERVLWRGKPLKMPFLASMFLAIVVGISVDVAIGYLMIMYGFNFGFVFSVELLRACLLCLFLTCELKIGEKQNMRLQINGCFLTLC